MSEVGEELVRSLVRGFSRSIILWLVSRKPHSGYKIVKEMGRLTGQNFHPGKVYPLLYELEEDGYITGNWVQRGRRRIKYYSITARGSKLLDSLRAVLEMPVRDVVTDLLGEGENPK